MGRGLFVLAWAALAAACGGEDAGSPADSGVATDAGAHDASTRDAETGSSDAQASDATPSDAGVRDASTPVDGGASGGRLALGTAALQSSATCRATELAVSSCLHADISGCADVPTTGVLVKITEPTIAVKGTIVFGNGGPGTAFYEATGAPAVDELLVPLRDAGFRVVQLAFDQPGWLVAPGGPMAEACRPATILRALYDQFGEGGTKAFCASGNSGGSAMFAYALAHYGAESFIDAAVLSSGPPLGRIDLGCLGANDQAWQTDCARLRVCPAGLCTYIGGSYGLMEAAYGDTRCMEGLETDRQEFRDDSVVNGLEDVDYPSTEVRFVYGGADCSEAVPLGRVYAEAITSSKQTTVVPSAAHAIAASVAGAAQLYQDLSAACVLRH